MAEAIGESATKRNLRNVFVNAQIKAMVSLIEASMSLVFCIMIYLTIRVTYGSTAVMAFLYMVILPYSFLMNTSHNKNRIVDHGWKNVVNNILGRKQNLLNDSENTPSTESTDSTSKKDKGNQTRHGDIKIFTSLRLWDVGCRCRITRL